MITLVAGMLGGWELLIILALIFIFLLGAAAVLGLAFFLIRTSHRTRSTRPAEPPRYPNQKLSSLLTLGGFVAPILLTCAVIMIYWNDRWSYYEKVTPPHEITVRIKDNTAVSLTTSGPVAKPVANLPGDELGRMDLIWTKEGGGTLSRNPNASTRILPLPDATTFEEAETLMLSRKQLLQKSIASGAPATQCRFFGVVTTQGYWEVVHILDFKPDRATLCWKWEKG